MVVRCTVRTCNSVYNNKEERKFFRFPNDMPRCKQWIKACGRPELLEQKGVRFHTYFFMCDLHFQPSDRLQHQLKKNSVPSLRLAPFINENPEKCTQTDYVTGVQEHEWSSESNKRKLSGDHPDAKKKCKTSKKALASVSADTSTSPKYSVSVIQLLKFIFLQKELNVPKKEEMEKKILFALKVYMTIPHTYIAIKELLDLPAGKKLCKDYIDMDTKLSSNALTCLEMKIKTMKKSEKYCTIYAEKVDVQCDLYYHIKKDRIIGFHDINGVQMAEPATHAIVIVARGIFSDWEQQLTYCFLSKGDHKKELSVWLNETLSQVMRIGLNITALISRYDKIFTDAATLWGVTLGKPYFFVNEKKIYYIFEFSNLVNSLRNKLMEHDFLFHDAEGNELIATCEDVKTVSVIDSQRQYPLASELTETRVSPTRKDKMKTELVAQIFSKPVVAVMFLSKDLGQLEEKSMGTIKLLQIITETAEIINSSLDLTVSAAESKQIVVIKQFISFLKDMIVWQKYTNNDITKTIKCLKGLEVTLRNILALSQDLKLKRFKILNTSKICQSAAQKFISLTKAKKIKKPTPVELSRAFKKYFIDNILKLSKDVTSCDGLDKLLSMKLNSGTESFQGKVERSLLIGTVDYRFKVPEEFSLIYVCGYLLKKCHIIHKCVNFPKFLQSTFHKNEPYFEAFSKDTSIVLPPDNFIHLIERMDKVFIQSFQNKEIHSIGNEIKSEIYKMTMDLCCPSFPFEYVIKLFIRFRIFNVIRSNKKNFLDKSFKWKCFCLYNI